MRIAQISPLFEAVPPKLYGGTERVVYSLTEELVAMGHDVTLFASGDSVTSATLAPNRFWSCAFADCTNLRFPFNDEASGKWSSTERMPTKPVPIEPLCLRRRSRLMSAVALPIKPA